MKKKYLAKLLSVALSAAMAFTSVIPSYAMEGAEPSEEEPSEVVEEAAEEEASVDELNEDTVIENEEAEDADAETEAEAEEEAEELTEEVGEEEFEVKPASEVEELNEDAGLMAYQDADITFESYNQENVGAFTVAGDNATRLDTAATKKFDSTRDFVFYVVPKMGKVWNTATPVTVTGGYQPETGAAYTVTEGDDYEIESTDLYEAAVGTNYNLWDFSLAKKVTILGGSPIGTALATDTGSPVLRVTMATSAVVNGYVQIATAYEDDLTRPAIDLATSAYRPAYNATSYTVDISTLIDSSDSKKEIEVAVSLENGVAADSIAFDEVTGDWSDSAIKATYKLDADRKTLHISSFGINTAYKLAKSTFGGYKLTLTFSEGEAVVATTVSLKPASTNYVTFKKNDDTAITTSGISIVEGEAFTFKAAIAENGDESRILQGVNYTVEGKAGSFEATDNEDGTFTIPSAKVTGNITLLPVTGEQVTIAAVTGARFVVGENEKTLSVSEPAILSGDKLTVSPDNSTTVSEALTGEDYTFLVIADDGKKISNVKVEMYDKSGSGKTVCTEANGKLVKGDFGQYTVKAITGKLDIAITTATDSSEYDAIKVVKLGTEPANIRLYRVSDAKEITGSTIDILENGETLKFKAVPASGISIKSIGYAIGQSETFEALTGTANGDGTYTYTIPEAITDNLYIQIESQAGFTFAKYPNEDVSVKVNNVELSDDVEDPIAGVAIGNGITLDVTAQNGAEIVGVWYEFDGNLATLRTDEDAIDAGIEAGEVVPLGTSGTKLTAEYLTEVKGDADDHQFVIYVQTKRAADSAEYTSKITRDGLTAALKSLELYAGGNTATLDTTFTRKDGGYVEGSNEDNTTYELSKTGVNAIATFGTPETEDFNDLTTTDLAKSGAMTDVITVTELQGWPASTSYTATLPLTVKPVASLFDGLDIALDIDETGTKDIGLRDEDKVVRVYTEANADKINDVARLSIVPFNMVDGKKVPLEAFDLTDFEGLIEEIEWVTDPEYTPTKINPELKAINPTISSAVHYELLDISQIKNAGTVTATAKVTYTDGSIDEATIELSAIPQTYGYASLAVFDYLGETVILPEVTESIPIELEKKDGGLNSFDVSYRVFELLNPEYNWEGVFSAIVDDDRITDESISKYLNGSGKKVVREITDATFGDAVVEDENIVSSSVKSGVYTFSAENIGKTEVCGWPIVDGSPVSSIPYFEVTVLNNISTVSWTLSLEETYGDMSVGTKYAKPQLKPTAAILSNEHSNKGSDEQGKITGFVFDKMYEGKIIKLPTIDDFDLTTVNPKYTLIGWSNGNGRHYAPGENYAVRANDAITAVFAPKYADITVYNDVTEEPLSATEDLGIGVTIPLSVKYYALDEEEYIANIETGPNTGKPQPVYSDTLITAASGFTATKRDAESTALKIEGSNITGQNANSAAVVDFKWVDGDATYTSELTPAATTFTVKAVTDYTLDMDDVTIEEGQTKTFKAYFYQSTATKEESINFNNSAINSVSAKIKDAGKDNAEAIVPVEDGVYANDSYVYVTGLKAGTTATLVLSVVSKQNKKYEKEVTVTVTAATKKISLKNSKTTDIQIPVTTASTATAEFELLDAGTAVVTSEGLWTLTDISSEDIPEDDVLIDGDGTVVASGKTATATLNVNESTFGTGTVEVDYVIDERPATFEAVSARFDVNSYYQYTFNAQLGDENPGSVYVVLNDGVEVANAGATPSGNIVEKVVYSGAENYTVSNAAKYTAEYLNGDKKNSSGKTNTDTQVFLGWNTVEAKFANAAEADYEANQAITVDADEFYMEGFDENGNLDLYVTFGKDPITRITGIPESITLTDEAPASEYSRSASDSYTDHALVVLGQYPVGSTAAITVSADDVSLFNITKGNSATEQALPDRSEDGDNGGDTMDTIWNIGSTVPVELPIFAVGNPATSKTGSFAVAKIAGKVGTSNIHVASGTLVYDIPVYLNGEYLDDMGTAVGTDDVYRYMENGVVLTEGVRTVNGRSHFYKNSQVVVNDTVEIEVDGVKRLALIENGVQVKTAGYKIFKDKTYYIDADGYVSTGLVTIDGKDYLFREDGSQVFYTDADVKDGKVEVAGVNYLIDKDTNEAAPDKIYTYLNHKFTWPTELGTATTPAVTAEVTYTVTDQDGKKTTETLAPKTLVVSELPEDGNFRVFEATLTTVDGVEKFEVKKYNSKTGKFGEGVTVEGLEDEYEFTGSAIKPVFTVYDNDAMKTLVAGTDYTIKYTNNNPKVTALPATATITITGKGNYDKQTLTRTFKIVNPVDGETATEYYDVKSVKVEKEASPLTYDGTPKYPTKLTIKTADKKTITATFEDGEYTFSDTEKAIKIVVSNNIAKGSGTVAVYGSNFAKPVKKNFAIKAADLSKLGENLEIVAGSAEYTKKGAKAGVYVTYDNGTEVLELVEGRDYTVKYAYSNKKNAGESAGSAYIQGKGNYSGNTKNTQTVPFEITKYDLAEGNVIVNAYAGLAPKAIKVKVYDANGDEISAKEYAITKVELDGTDVTGSSAKMTAGAELAVTIKGNGNNVTDDEVIVNTVVGAKTAKFDAKALTKTYEGVPVTLTAEDMEKVTATAGSVTIKYGEDYEIVSYKNNNKKGTMTVFVQGTSAKFSGAGKFTVKILPKPVKDADN